MSMMTKETKAEQLKLIAYILEQDLLWEYLPDDEDVWHFGHFEADLMTCFNRGWEIRLKNPKKTDQVDNIYLKAFKKGKRVQWLVPHKNEWVDYDKMVWLDVGDVGFQWRIVVTDGRIGDRYIKAYEVGKRIQASYGGGWFDIDRKEDLQNYINDLGVKIRILNCKNIPLSDDDFINFIGNNIWVRSKRDGSVGGAYHVWDVEETGINLADFGLEGVRFHVTYEELFKNYELTIKGDVWYPCSKTIEEVEE